MIAPTAKSREQIEILHDPLAPFRGPRGGYRLSGEVPIERASDVHAVSGGKQPEACNRREGSRQKPCTVRRAVVPISNIENSVIPNRLHEIGSRLFNRLVAKTDSQAGHACIHGKPAYLLTGHAKDTSRVLIEVAIEHPILAGDEFLD